MTQKSSFDLRARNPDVLTCIANLSNDEVFTPPELAKQMLQSLAKAWSLANGGANLWADKSVKFLDPCVKSGVFLREITSHLTQGLASEIPDLDERVNHILTRQIFGLGITTITSLLARRSTYCSKNATGKHSIAKDFKDHAGNIWFQRTEHLWADKRCRICGAPKTIFDRGKDLENHAYAFIHSAHIKARIDELFGESMRFDVIIGNPPYQMTGGSGGSSDSSIYHLFIEQALKLEPRYISMVIPSRWMAGGRGLDNFREKMLNCGHLQALTDFPNSVEAFPGVQIKGGVCYFLWNSSHQGECDVTRVEGGMALLQKNRRMGEFDVFVRDERALSILRKVLAQQEASVANFVSGDTPFGLSTNFAEWGDRKKTGMIELHLIKKSKRVTGYTKKNCIRKRRDILDSWKVLIPESYGAGETSPHQILGKEIIAAPHSACTQSYLVVAPFASELEAENFASYYRTRFFRFLVSLRKITQHALKSTYTWVPQQAWDRSWTDQQLYIKYGLSAEEIDFIAAKIRTMGPSDE